MGIHAYCMCVHCADMYNFCKTTLTSIIVKHIQLSKNEAGFPPPVVFCLGVSCLSIVTMNIWVIGISALNLLCPMRHQIIHMLYQLLSLISGCIEMNVMSVLSSVMSWYCTLLFPSQVTFH